MLTPATVKCAPSPYQYSLVMVSFDRQGAKFYISLNKQYLRNPRGEREIYKSLQRLGSQEYEYKSCTQKIVVS